MRVVGKHGIKIAARGVTLDLNGFDLVGVPAMGSFDGVTVAVANLTDIAVLNGSVRTWGDEGVDFGAVSQLNSLAKYRKRPKDSNGNTTHKRPHVLILRDNVRGTNIISRRHLIALFAVGLLTSVSTTGIAQTTVSATSKFAWGENVGWINLDFTSPQQFVAFKCYADCDGSGGLSPADFTCFLARHGAGCP
jgi:hypothetical protein